MCLWGVLPGVVVDLASKRVTIRHNGGPDCSTEVFADAVKSLGFAARSFNVVKPAFRTVSLSVDGMKCMKNCGSRVKAALLALPGVSGSWFRVEACHVVCTIRSVSRGVHDVNCLAYHCLVCRRVQALTSTLRRKRSV